MRGITKRRWFTCAVVWGVAMAIPATISVAFFLVAMTLLLLYDAWALDYRFAE